MPATKLTRALFNPVRQNESTCNVIRELMAEHRIRTQAELADRLRLSPSQLSRRMSEGGWSGEELWRIVYELKPSEAQLLRMMAYQQVSA